VVEVDLVLVVVIGKELEEVVLEDIEHQHKMLLLELQLQ
jgi:hypothetical protein